MKKLIFSALRRSLGNSAVDYLKRASALIESPEKLFDVRAGFATVEGVLVEENIGSNGTHAFAGYFDRTPVSNDEKTLLYGECDVRKDSRAGIDALSLTIKKIGCPGTERVLDRTHAWSWQQGAMQQWLPGPKNRVLYNAVEGDRAIAKIFDCDAWQQDRVFDRPIYSISPDGSWGLSCNFQRLARMRPGYGIGVLADLTKGKLTLEDDGVVLVNLKSGESRLLYTLKQLSRFHPNDSMQSAEHYVHHFGFAPCGTKFLMFHLWSIDGRQYSRGLVGDIASGSLECLTKNYVSHYGWINEHELIMYSWQPEYGNAYYIYSIKDCSYRRIDLVGLREDGHCTFIPSTRQILTDTYPNRVGFQRLLIATEQGIGREIGRFYSPVRFREEYRCDLHPRASLSGKYIAIDSVHSGRRRLLLLNLGTR